MQVCRATFLQKNFFPLAFEGPSVSESKSRELITSIGRSYQGKSVHIRQQLSRTTSGLRIYYGSTVALKKQKYPRNPNEVYVLESKAVLEAGMAGYGSFLWGPTITVRAPLQGAPSLLCSLCLFVSFASTWFPIHFLFNFRREGPALLIILVPTGQSHLCFLYQTASRATHGHGLAILNSDAHPGSSHWASITQTTAHSSSVSKSFILSAKQSQMHSGRYTSQKSQTGIIQDSALNYLFVWGVWQVFGSYIILVKYSCFNAAPYFFSSYL